ncbi:MAG: BsuPI-related putative proteinase inhibitor [Thermoprotei archaeon]
MTEKLLSALTLMIIALAVFVPLGSPVVGAGTPLVSMNTSSQASMNASGSTGAGTSQGGAPRSSSGAQGFGSSQEEVLVYGANYSATPSGIVFNIWVKNNGSQTATVYTGFPEAQVIISNNALTVWSSSYGHFYPMIIFPLHIAAGQQFKWNFTWNYTDDAGLRVSPGEYQASAFALGQQVAAFQLSVSLSGIVSPSTASSTKSTATNSAAYFSIRVHPAGKRQIVVNMKIDEFGASAANLSELIDQLGLDNSLFTVNAGPFSVVSMGTYRGDHEEVHQFVVFDANGATYYGFNNATRKVIENTIFVSSSAAQGAMAELKGNTTAVAGISASILEEQTAFAEMRDSSLTGNYHMFMSALDKLVRAQVGEKVQVAAQLSEQNEKVPEKAFIKGLLTGAAALEKNVETQFKITEDQGNQVPEAANAAFVEGENNLTQAIQANSAGNLGAAFQYVKASMRAFQNALVLNAKARSSSMNEQAGLKANVTAKLDAAWRLENVTASLVPANSAAEVYITGQSGAKADLDSAQAALKAGNYSEAETYISEALQDLKYALRALGDFT